ncbi:stage II sporulation protein D [Gottfriedia luciferensis]|uniref:stage II sporulation protein D n=1 Tax=Gottfriedia luciferensis TaxID=178774 RepID=UPI000B43A327|nr:stage II sporulation protein D [Gottfriedia luciferensis]
MKSFKTLITAGLTTCSVVIIIPTLLVLPFHSQTDGRLVDQLQKKANQAAIANKNDNLSISVFRTKTQKVEKLPIEEYVLGVVASEMPAKFELEALKAQSLSARTFIIKRLKEGKPLEEGGIVDDTVQFQVFQDRDDLKKRYGAQYEANIAKIERAVKATEGQILTYDGQPITASFFSSSNGYTENSEEYWNNSAPYLKSVPSPWDSVAPDYIATKAVSINDFEQKLNVKINKSDIGKVIARTNSNRVEKVAFGKKTLTGKEIREKLNLRSTDFSWERKGDEIIITTKGYGHGVGMSQYGANELAKQGKTYDDIVKYYYKGVNITKLSKKDYDKLQ